MATFNEARRTGEHIISEASGTRSREVVTIVSGAGKLFPGQVLGKITASGKFDAYDNSDTTTGIGAAAAVLYSAVDATNGDVKAVVHVRDCEVTSSLLTGIDTAGTADLATLGVIVR
ncbi:MAG: head decoration protein [Candidatus Dactylopiibacterium sp.]|nr:head decoration protein [Candidatus Dactylopiibacterium sp.]